MDSVLVRCSIDVLQALANQCQLANCFSWRPPQTQFLFSQSSYSSRSWRFKKSIFPGAAVATLQNKVTNTFNMVFSLVLFDLFEEIYKLTRGQTLFGIKFLNFWHACKNSNSQNHIKQELNVDIRRCEAHIWAFEGKWHRGNIYSGATRQPGQFGSWCPSAGWHLGFLHLGFLHLGLLHLGFLDSWISEGSRWQDTVLVTIILNT